MKTLLNPIHRHRFYRRYGLIALIVGGVATAITLLLVTLGDNIVFYRTTTETLNTYHNGTLDPTRPMRLGGMVVDDSFRVDDNGIVHFALTDFATTLAVQYRGILPDLFREGQGVIAEGQLQIDQAQTVFIAQTVLAKHDEVYMPPEIAAEQGRSRSPYGADRRLSDGAEQTPVTAAEQGRSGTPYGADRRLSDGAEQTPVTAAEQGRSRSPYGADRRLSDGAEQRP